MKPFDLEAAKRGTPVQTRDGRPARIVNFDNNKSHPILAIIPNAADGEETPYSYTNFGMCNPYFKSKVDLFMAPIKREGRLHETEEEAVYGRADNEVYVATAKITWEE